MRRFLATTLLLCCAAAPAQEVPLKVDGPGVKDVDRVIMVPKVVTERVVTSFPATVHAPEGAGLYFWTYPPGVTATDKGDRLEITAAPKGQLTVGVKSISAKLDKDGKFVGFVTAFGSITLNIGDVPQPPGPDPKPPVPPAPPGPVTGLRVVFVLEKQGKLTPLQFTAVYSPKVAAYLDAKCQGGKDGWRRWDQHQDVSGESQLWRDLWAATKPKLGTLPAVVIVTDQQGVVLPLPNDEAACLELLRKYGG